MHFNKEENKITVSARELVSIARRGLSPTPTRDSDEPSLSDAKKSILTSILGEASEITLTHTAEYDAYGLEICANVSKICDTGCLYFIKSGDIDPERPKKEFTAQMRGESFIAAYIYAMKNALSSVEIKNIYVNGMSGAYNEIIENAKLEALEKFYKKCLSALNYAAMPETERVTKRLPSMKSLKFPYGKARDGQREFIKISYKTMARGGTLFATAPTGTGKTVSALYPAIKVMGDGRRTKTFYLTPKETTALAARDCLLTMASHGAIIRSVILTSKEKLCKRGSLCKESKEYCPTCKCNNLTDATLELFKKNITVIEKCDIDEVASKFTVCPYELALSYAELCDVVICDFNYLFDRSVYIRRFFDERGNYIFLIDEAHNLPDRARELYSAEISTGILSEPSENSLLGEFSETKSEAKKAEDKFKSILLPYVKSELLTDDEGSEVGAVHLSEIPAELFELFEYLIKCTDNETVKNYKASDEEKNARIKLLRNYYYTLSRFYASMLAFESGYKFFVFYKNGELRAKIFCISTGAEISKRISRGAAAVFFSATLTPIYYYKALLGNDGTADTLEVPSPFDRDQLSVSIVDNISTRFSEREETLSAVIRTIAASIGAKKGNYMVFCPSFAYAEALSEAFKQKYPKLNVLTQKKNMSAEEKQGFLDEFTKNNSNYLVAFCVMGGIYSEGIDLAGEALIGAIIVGIGLPGLSYEREAIAAYYEDKYEEGKQFAYIYPGVNRVLQAAGRVIRREDDRGIIVLIDDRFRDPIYKKVIPKLWSGMKFCSDPKLLRERIEVFWKKSK